jgi:hypothetical protein
MIQSMGARVMSGEPGPGEAVSVALAECDMHLNNLDVRQRNFSGSMTITKISAKALHRTALF